MLSILMIMVSVEFRHNNIAHTKISYRMVGNFGGGNFGGFGRFTLICQNFLHQIFIFMESAVVKNRLCRIFPTKHVTRNDPPKINPTKILRYTVIPYDMANQLHLYVT